MNYFSELKKCGELLFRKKQHWEFVSIVGQPQYLDILSSALSLSKEFIQKNNGAWLVDLTKEANFAQLTPNDQAIIDNQLNEMIRTKYLDINFNGNNFK